MALLAAVSADLIQATAAFGVNGISGATFTGWGDAVGAYTFQNPTAGGRANRKFLQLYSSNGSRIYWNWTRSWGASATTVFMGFAFQPSANTNSTIIIQLGSSTTSGSVGGILFTLGQTGTSLVLQQGSTGAVVGTATNVFTKAGGSFPNNAWYYIEFSWPVTSASSGNVTVRVDGTAVLSGVSTAFAYAGNLASQLGVWATNFNSNAFMDFYMCDDTGSVNNTFLGDSRVDHLVPTGTGSNTAWSLGAGSDVYSAVASYDADTSYIHASALNQKETYVTADLAATGTTIKGAQVFMLGKQNTTTNRKLAGVTRSGGTDYTAADAAYAPQGRYGPVVGTFDTNPNTGVAWTEAQVNAAEFGVSVTN